MGRKIAVTLDLEAGRLLSESKAVEKEMKAVDNQVKALGRQVDSTGRDMDQLAVQTGIAKRQVDDLGDKARTTAVALRALDMRIAATKASVHDLGVEFATTGDKATGKELGSERSLLGRLSKLRNELAEEGRKSGESFLGGISSALSGSGGAIQTGAIAGLVGGVVALSPMIGAVISGAVVGTVGAGGILGGIIAAGHDDRVKAEWARFAGTVSKESFGSDAFTGPVIESIGVIEKGFNNLRLGDALSKGAGSVPTLAKGVSNFANNIMPGFNAVMDKSGPISVALANGLGMTGDELGSLLTKMANSEGALDGLRTGFALLGGTIKVTGEVVTGLTDAYHGILTAFANIGGALEDIPGLDQAGWADLNDDMERLLGITPQLETRITGFASAEDLAIAKNATLGSGLTWLVGKIADYSNAAYYAAIKTGDLGAVWDVLHGKMLSADQALLAAKQGVENIKNTFADGTKSIEGNSQAVLENRVALEENARQTAAAAGEYFKNHVAVDGVASATAGATKIMQDQKKVAEDATGATGAQRAAVNKLADALYGLPDEVKVQIIVQTIYTQVGKALDTAAKAIGGLFGARAAGGPVEAGVPYIVGEKQPEVFMPKTDGYVYPSVGDWKASKQGSSWQAGAAMSGGGQGGTMRHVVDLQVNGRTVKTLLIDDAVGRGVPESTVRVAYP